MIMWAALAYVAVAAIVFTVAESSPRKIIKLKDWVRPWFIWSVHALLCLLWPALVLYIIVDTIRSRR